MRLESNSLRPPQRIDLEHYREVHLRSYNGGDGQRFKVIALRLALSMWDLALVAMQSLKLVLQN